MLKDTALKRLQALILFQEAGIYSYTYKEMAI